MTPFGYMILGGLLAAFVWVPVGMVGMAMMVAASDADEQMGRERRQE